MKIGDWYEDGLIFNFYLLKQSSQSFRPYNYATNLFWWGLTSHDSPPLSQCVLWSPCNKWCRQFRLFLFSRFISGWLQYTYIYLLLICIDHYWSWKWSWFPFILNFICSLLPISSDLWDYTAAIRGSFMVENMSVMEISIFISKKSSSILPGFSFSRLGDAKDDTERDYHGQPCIERIFYRRPYARRQKMPLVT